jgi:hypothetical protein
VSTQPAPWFTRTRTAYPPFPDWLSDQVERSDAIGHLARLFVRDNEIDRSDIELLNAAIIEWSQT